MSLLSNAVSNVIGRKKFVSVDDDGDFLLLADTGKDLAGVWVLEFVPDNDEPFDGQLSVQGRIQGQQAFEDAVGFAPIPYRPWILNTVTGDLELTTAAITGHSLIAIPATGLAVALLVSATSGKGVLYSYPRQGDGAF